jgi:hypothetical protein
MGMQCLGRDLVVRDMNMGSEDLGGIWLLVVVHMRL